MAVASRAIERQAAIKADLEELTQEQEAQEAEEAAYAEAALETMERDTRLEQEAILREHPTSRYVSLEAWQDALRHAGFYYEDMDLYQEVLRYPEASFGSYEDDGDWYVGIGYTAVLPDGTTRRYY